MKYNKGDIILVGGSETWVCKAANVFRQIDFGLIKQNSIGESIGGEIIPRDYVSSTVNLSKGSRIISEYHPVIGTVGDEDCSYPLWNIAAIQVHYPILYKEIITKEYAKV